MLTLENQSGQAVTVEVISMPLDKSICGVTTTRTNGSEYLITINSDLIKSWPMRARVALIHELLHVYNWQAGHNKRRHQACHYLACAIAFGAGLRLLKIKSPKAVVYLRTIADFAKDWFKNYTTQKHS